MAELLQSHHKTLIDEELLLTDEQQKWFLETEFTLGEEAVKIVNMTKKGFRIYYTNLVDKSAIGLR